MTCVVAQYKLQKTIFLLVNIYQRGRFILGFEECHDCPRWTIIVIGILLGQYVLSANSSTCLAMILEAQGIWIQLQLININIRDI